MFPSIASSVAVLCTFGFEALLPAAEDVDCRARRPRHRQQRLRGAACVRAAVQAGLERAAQAADGGARRARLAGAGDWSRRPRTWRLQGTGPLLLLHPS